MDMHGRARSSKGMAQDGGEQWRKAQKGKNMDFEKAAEKRKQDITKEALRLLRANLQKEYVGLEAEWKKISAEYLGRINVIDVMLGEAR